MDQYFLIAEVKAVTGSQGYVLIESFSDFSERFFRLKRVYIDFFNNKKDFVVEDVKGFEGKVEIKFRGFDNQQDAKLLIGKKIYVVETDLVKLDKDTFFIHDLIGAEVFRNALLIGHVSDVYLLPANDVYVVTDLNNRKILVPAVKDYIHKIDPVKKRLDLVKDCDLLYDED